MGLKSPLILFSSGLRGMFISNALAQPPVFEEFVSLAITMPLRSQISSWFFSVIIVSRWGRLLALNVFSETVGLNETILGFVLLAGLSLNLFIKSIRLLIY
jgi:hypothetical protein